MSANEAKRKYDIQYAKEKLKRIPLDVKKEKYEELRVAAEAAGEPINGYIKKAIDERMERESRMPPSPAASQLDTPQAGAVPDDKPEKRYQPFTEADARRIDLPELLTNLRYQMDISETFGMEVLGILLEKARQQAGAAE